MHALPPAPRSALKIAFATFACTVLASSMFALAAAASGAPLQDPAPQGSAPQADAPKPEPPKEEPPFAKVDGPRGVRTRKAGTEDGVTLIAPLNSKSTYLVDLEGRALHTWKADHVPAAATYLLANGHLLRTGMSEDNPRFHGGGIGGRIEERDWDGKLVWEYELANDQRTTHHDICRMPNGNVLAIAYEYHSPEEAFDKGRAIEHIDEKDGLWFDVVIEIKPTYPKGGEIVWEWRSFDHIVQDLDPELAGYGKPSDFPGRIDINADHRFDRAESEAERLAREERTKQIQSLGYTGGKAALSQQKQDETKPKPKKNEHAADWLHINSVELLSEYDLIAVSVPHMHEIWIIDHSTTTAEAASDRGGRWKSGGEILYRFGNPQYYGGGSASDRTLFYQHNASWLHSLNKGEFAMLYYNNGSERPGKEYSSVEEVVLPFLAAERKAGKPFPPPTVVWSYQDPDKLFSPFISGAQRLPNGNTLICEGARGRVIEVTRAGEIVWDFYNPFEGEVKPKKQQGQAPGHSLFRATRIPAGHPAIAGRLSLSKG